MFTRGEVEVMDTSEAKWCWQYLAECGRWHRFEDDPDNPLRSEDIERCYLRDSKGVLDIASTDRHSQINFSDMLQTDSKTGRIKRIQRGYFTESQCSCFSECPVFWEKVDPACPYQLIPLNEFSPEYNTVETYLKKDGLLDRSLVSISRIQNLDLWEMYCRKKKQIRRIHNVTEIQERRLFHGTARENVNSICKYNFDLRLAGTNAHVYGKGIYFAKHAALADRYSDGSTDPLQLHGGETRGVSGELTKIIFLARVIIGESIVGLGHFIKPDHGCCENSHYSCVDDINHPNIFVIFDPNQVYPEYLIQYR